MELIVNGTPANLTVKASGDESLVLKGSDFEVRLSGDCAGAACAVKTTAAGKPYIELVSSGATTFSGSGYKPGSTIDVWMFSTPSYLGSLTVGADGSFSGQLNVPALSAGEHTLQLNGVSSGGSARTMNIGVVLSPVKDEMPETGYDSRTAFALGTAMLLLGAGLLLSARRRPVALRVTR